MESEGIYRYEHRAEQKAFVVVGPGWESTGGTYTKNEASKAARLANLAHAEGLRMAAEMFREAKVVAFKGSASIDGYGFYQSILSKAKEIEETAK